MMKTLVICRHAKSSWQYAVDDIYRPLNARGLRQAPEMARQCEIEPDKVMCSPAVRAWSTAVCYFTECHWDFERLQIVPELYDANSETIISLLQHQDESAGVVFIFGHNPDLNQLIYTLTLDTSLPDNIVTAARVTLALNIASWQDLTSGCAEVFEWRVPSKKPD